MKKIFWFSALISAAPLAAFAATADVFTVLSLIGLILTKYIIPLLITLAVVYFIWGVIQYTVSQDEEAKKGARGKIINGLIGLFVIIAFWGIIFLVTNTFGVGSAQLNSNDIPCINTPGVIC